MKREIPWRITWRFALSSFLLVFDTFVLVSNTQHRSHAEDWQDLKRYLSRSFSALNEVHDWLAKEVCTHKSMKQKLTRFCWRSCWLAAGAKKQATCEGQPYALPFTVRLPERPHMWKVRQSMIVQQCSTSLQPSSCIPCILEDCSSLC